jgi:signal peptidase I
MSQTKDNTPWRLKYRPYFIAMACAFVLTMLVAPEVQETGSMEPTISEGQVIVMKKTTYSVKRAIPSQGDIIVLKKHAIETDEDNAVRRVIAVGGDEVSLKNTELLVNGEVVRQNCQSNIGDEWSMLLKANEVFLLCDNEKYGTDSLDKEIGNITVDEIRGKAILKIWPLTEIGEI